VLAAIFGIGALVAGRRCSRITDRASRASPVRASPSAAARGGGAAGAVFALGLIEAGAVAILTILCQHGLRRRGVHRRLPQLQQLAAQRRSLLCRQRQRCPRRRGGDPDPGAPLLSIALNANVLAPCCCL